MPTYLVSHNKKSALSNQFGANSWQMEVVLTHWHSAFQVLGMEVMLYLGVEQEGFLFEQPRRGCQGISSAYIALCNFTSKTFTFKRGVQQKYEFSLNNILSIIRLFHFQQVQYKYNLTHFVQVKPFYSPFVIFFINNNICNNQHVMFSICQQ